ncbi:uncharacterized protein LOC117646224 isoform X2 [Thrips palmi]|uniref:Uncharacterized protein LOC117646224 isoform X2 n=1 Tax=Thrips palmi TaxID=161013 RepID=A0A6P8YS95_THRPL|nr:uncharacterized protein LOC117646224 isoform X2 [Thrips palmi]
MNGDAGSNDVTAMAGMYVNVRVLSRQLHHLSAEVDSSMSKLLAVQRRQEAQHDKLYDHVNRAEGGRVASTAGTPPYQAEDVSLHFLGIRLYHYTRADPNAMLQALPGPELDERAVELGRFVYKIDDLPLQIFRIPRPVGSFRYVALRIDSNHGHPDFTCVYRFRVHGFLDHDDGLHGHGQLVEAADAPRDLQH